MSRFIPLISSLIACLFAISASAQVDPGAGGGEPRKVFITSVSGTADLSTWPDANGATGIAAGDSICQSRAAAANLPSPGNYIAWLSNSEDDAYCRLHSLSGKRDNNCGQVELPSDAGPWVRTDGSPFAAEVGLALLPSQNVFLPPKFDEFGNEVLDESFARSVYTGTDGRGELKDDQQSCQDWASDDAGFIGIGDVYMTGAGWSSFGSTGCGGVRKLFCVERGSGVPLPPLEAEGNLAFVTSVTGNGDLASWPEADSGTVGVEAGDSICRNLADAAGLENAGLFKAWLSDSSESADQRLLGDGPWVRPDGVLVAESLSDLTTNPRNTAIAVTEQGDYLGNNRVWTGTSDIGETEPNNCDDWRDATTSFNARQGYSNRSSSGWSSGLSSSCDVPNARLYCLEDGPDILFDDDFEL